MNRVYKLDRSHYKKQKKDSLLYVLVNFILVVFFLWVFYENLTLKEFFERLKFDYQIILFLLACFFCYVNYSTWQELKDVEFFSEIQITPTEIIQSTGLIDERIKVSDIAKISHNEKDKKDEYILVELTNDQFIAISEYEDMASIYRDLKKVWRR